MAFNKYQSTGIERKIGNIDKVVIKRYNVCIREDNYHLNFVVFDSLKKKLNYKNNDDKQMNAAVFERIHLSLRKPIYNP